LRLAKIRLRGGMQMAENGKGKPVQRFGKATPLSRGPHGHIRAEGAALKGASLSGRAKARKDGRTNPAAHMSAGGI